MYLVRWRRNTSTFLDERRVVGIEYQRRTSYGICNETAVSDRGVWSRTGKCSIRDSDTVSQKPRNLIECKADQIVDPTSIAIGWRFVRKVYIHQKSFPLLAPRLHLSDKLSAVDDR